MLSDVFLFVSRLPVVLLLVYACLYCFGWVVDSLLIVARLCCLLFSLDCFASWFVDLLLLILLLFGCLIGGFWCFCDLLWAVFRFIVDW